jgi:hypothetical protein
MMALDRFVRWNGRVPSVDDIEKSLESFLGGVGEIEKIARSKDMTDFIVSLPGKGSDPFDWSPEAMKCPNREERWIEVIVTDDYVDVLTRQMDSFTNGIAERFAADIARFWQGKRG